MSIPGEFSIMWVTHPQWFEVREMLKVPKWINETCCVQISHAMNAADLPVVPPPKRNWINPSNGKSHFLEVSELRKYLRDTWGDADVDSRATGIDKDLNKFKAEINGRQGIIVFGTRHIDLWGGDRIHGENYIENALWKAPSTLTMGILLWEVG